MAHVSVIIDGKTYRMACDDGQEDHLQALAEKMDAAVQQLREGFGDVGDQRLAIMAGIMMADELAESEKQKRILLAELETVKESRQNLIDRYQSAEETLARALLEVSEKVDDLTQKLNSRQVEDRASKSHKFAAG